MKKEHLKLFIPISEWIPEKGKCFVIDNHGTFKESHFDGRKFNEHDFITITHVLDLSKLTTKSLAEQLARDYVKEYVKEVKEEFYEMNLDYLDYKLDDFITQNINKL